MESFHIFDEIRVTQRGDRKPPIREGKLTFDKKGVSAGDRANFFLRFKDVDVVELSTAQRDVYDDRRYARGGRGGRSSETVTLKLAGKKMKFVCTVSKGGSAREAHALESFVSGLKDAHRKVMVKGGGKDPYALEEKKRGGGGAIRVGIKSSNKKSRPLVTPSQGLFLSPGKKRSASAGSFRSPERRRGSDDNDRDRGGKADQYAHYDPASHSATPKAKAGTPSHFTNNNVVLEPESPAARKLNLPPKSPRNATPTKVRFVGAKGSPTSRSITDRLNEIGGGEGESKKKKQVTFDPFDEDELGAFERRQKGKGEAPKRRKLKKVGGEMEDGSDDSDPEMEFDESSELKSKPPPSARKKLKLSINDESDDDDGTDEEMEDAAELKVPQSPSPASVADVPEESAGPKPSAADLALSPSPKKAPSKKGRLHSFFAPKSAAASGKKESTKEAKRSSPPTTHGGALSTPSKKARPESQGDDAPSTPPQLTTPRATPVQRQTQRKSRYFENDDGSKQLAAADSIGSKALKYSSEEEEDILPDYQDDTGYYSGGENEPVKEKHVTAYELSRQQRGKRRGAYGKNGASRLGQPRLGKVDYTRRREKVDFSGFEATTADSALQPRGLKQRSLALVRKDDKKEQFKPSAPPIPGIQNLGNTCYLSVSLQALFSVPDFIAGLYKTYAEGAIASPAKEMPLTKALLEVAVAIGVLKEKDCPLIDAEQGKTKLLANKVGNPAALKKQMDVLTDKFTGYEQRDAHEFLSDLVDYLHDELAASPKKSSDKETNAKEEETTGEKKENGKEEKEEAKGDAAATTQHERSGLLTDEYFHLNVRVCLECDACGYSRSKNELYRHLSVDVGEDSEVNKWTVERSLQQFFQPEKRELKCEKCEEGKTATQTMEITSCPKALLLHFKRFIVTQEAKGDGKENNETSTPPVMEMVLRKNKAKVPLEESLSINPFVGVDDESHTGKYHLRGVVHHVGGTACSGHYTACSKRALADRAIVGGEKSGSKDDAKAPDNEEHWLLFDDRVGTKKDLNYVTGLERNQRNCYLALYELK